MKYEAVRKLAFPAPLTAEPFFIPERDDDPMGVYVFEPAFTELTRLYFNLDPEDNWFAFDALVHEPNKATAMMLAHCYNLFGTVLAELVRVSYVHATGGGMGDIDWESIRRTLNAAYEVSGTLHAGEDDESANKDAERGN